MLHATRSEPESPRPPTRPQFRLLGGRGQPATLRLFDADPYTVVDTEANRVRAGYLLAFRGNTRSSYESDLKMWFAWCADHGIPILEAGRADIETYDLGLEASGRKPSTRQRKLIVICGYYLYAEQESFIDKSPGRYVRRPRVPNISTSEYLDRYELGRFLNEAEAIGPNHAILACLLALNGLRVTEAISANTSDVANANGHRILTIIRKGGKEADVPLAARTYRNIVLAFDRDGSDRPLMLDQLGQRMTRHSAARAIRLIASRSGIAKRLGPHSLRHTFVSIGLDAGVPLRDMQVAAGHADVSTTIRYDRRDHKLDKHAAYIVAAYAGGS